MRVALLGDWLHESLLAHGRLGGLLQRLNGETRETVVLAAQNGLYSQYLRVIEGKNTLRMHVPIGMTRPLLISGTGRILLTRMDDGVIRKLVRRHNVQQEQSVDLGEVLAQVSADRRRGYAFSKSRVTPHVGMIAMLLPTSAAEKPLAVGVAGLTEHLVANEQPYVQAMHEAIQSLAAPF
jgi:DNA-binding IclR family transcriptional regulator